MKALWVRPGATSVALVASSLVLAGENDTPEEPYNQANVNCVVN